jgi:hypothetical protein
MANLTAMKLRSVLGLVLGSVVVHLAVACGSQAVDGGPGGADSGAVVDAIIDVIADVPNAEAAPDGGSEDSGPTVTTATCSKMSTTGGVTVWLAELERPGKSMVDLATVRTLICVTDTAAATTHPSGYTCAVGSGGFVRDGVLAYNCGNDPSRIKSVTFIY